MKIEPYYDKDGITIYHGDCRDILPMLPKVDLVLTDPPYGIGWSKPYLENGNSRPHEGIQNDADVSVRDQVLRTVPCYRGIIFGSFMAPFPVGVRQVLIWHKPGDSGLFGTVAGFRRDVEPIFIVGDWGPSTVERSSVLRGTAKFRGHAAQETGSHPHAKPVDLITQLIEATDAQIILDPFMGSGTTLVAAKQLGRKAIGIEIEEKYCEIAVRRLAQSVFDFSEPEPKPKDGVLL